MSYPVDIEAAKSSKLFKKFMQSKNKSISITAPRIQNIQINRKQHQQEIFTLQKPAIVNSPKFQNNQKKNNFVSQIFPNSRQSQTIKRTFQTNNPIQQSKRELTYKQNQNQNENFQRKNFPSQQKFELKNKTDLQKKNDKLVEQYNQLKQKISYERKQNKKQIIKLQEQVQMLNKKVFQLRNKQDQLILQTKRLKQKSLSQIKEKKQIQQTNRQLNYQIQQLKDMLDGQQNTSKNKQDETSHWRKIIEDLKQKNRQLEQQIVKLKDLNNMAEREKFVSMKQVANKQLHLNQMREKINSMITQNGVLRDQIFHITGKLYHFEQQNKTLRADLKRHSDQFPMSYLQQQIQAARISRPQQSYTQYPQNSGEKSKIQSTETNEKRGERRRGQFARQRGSRKVQPQNNPTNQKIEQVPVTNQKQAIQNQNKDFGQAVRKLQQLNEQLQKIKDMKAMNGATRRHKINIQRQILELQQVLKSQN